MEHQKLSPLAVTQAEAIELLRSPKLLKRALKAGWIKPVIQGGLGRNSLFDYEDVVRLWKRFKDEKVTPPLLPCERNQKKEGWIFLELLGVAAFIAAIFYLLIR